MKPRLRLAVAVYAFLLRWYPASFRRAFGAEMLAVFVDQMSDADLHGGWQVLGVCLREFWELPQSIFREYRSGGMKGRPGMDHNSKRVEPVAGGLRLLRGTPGSPELLAGLPHLIIGVFGVLPGVLSAVGVPISQFVMTLGGIICIGCGLVGLVVAWLRGWPRWSASFYGYPLLLLVFAPLVIIQQAFQGNWMIYENSYTFLIAPFLLAVILLSGAWRDPARGMLAALPALVLLWLPVLEFVPTRVDGWVQLWIFALAGVTAMLVARSGRPGKLACLMLAFILLCGLPAAFVRTYLNDIPAEHASPETIAELLKTLMPTLLTAAAIILGPLLAGSAWQHARRSGRVARAGYALAMAGLLLNLLGNLGDFLFRGYGDKRLFLGWNAAGAAFWLILASLVLYLAGAILFSIPRLQQGLLRGGVRSVLLTLFSLLLPFLAISPLTFGTRYIPFSLPLQLYNLNDIQSGLFYLAGVIWMLVGAWLVSDLDRSQSRAEPAPVEMPNLVTA